jgi:hypothetical protein
MRGGALPPKQSHGKNNQKSLENWEIASLAMSFGICDLLKTACLADRLFCLCKNRLKASSLRLRIHIHCGLPYFHTLWIALFCQSGIARWQTEEET